MRELRSSSVHSFIQQVCELRTKWTAESDYFDPWFRGQRVSDWGLVPSVYRIKELRDEENEMRAEFMRKGTQLLGGNSEPKGDWGWYFLMRHHGTPTRLLDWSDSALIALFFALQPQNPERVTVSKDAAVWVLDPWWLNRRSIQRDSIILAEWDEAKAYLPPLFDGSVHRRYPVSIDPPHVARRLSVQRSRFTVHGTDPEGLTKLGARSSARLVKIIIPRKAIPGMRRDLYTCGVSDSTVFPDLEGLSRELIRWNLEPTD